MKSLFVSLLACGALIAPLAAVGQSAQDDIVQLNNLTITAIAPLSSVQGVTVISAQSPGIACLKYFDYRASAGFAYPCPASQVYQLRVQSNTILLLRNRLPATINDFSIGDHINVYGFLDPGGASVQALIMRDLDKPINSVKYFHQINNLEVQTAPGPNRPAVFTASGPSFAEPHYQITVNGQTAVLYRDRRVMPLGEIAVGDRVNVYGLYDSVARSFAAVVLRDMSRPAVTPPPPAVTLSFTATTDKSSYSVDEAVNITLTAYNNSALPQTLGFNSGCQTSYSISPAGYDSALGQYCTLALISVTIPAFSNRSWTMTHLPGAYRLSPGSYTLTARVIGYGSASTNFTVGGGGTGTGQPPVITSVSGPRVLQTNQSGTWMISAYSSSANNQLTYYVTWGDEPSPYGSTAMAPMPYAYAQTGTFTHTYANAGVYTVTFTVRDQAGMSVVSTLTVNVTGFPQSSPMLDSLSPTFGPIGTFVTAFGSGFAPTGNLIYFGDYGALMNVNSYDGRTLYFVVPQYIGPACNPNDACPQYARFLPSGVHQISVSNGIMRSNSVGFVVQ